MPALSDDDRVKAIQILEQVRVEIDAAAASDTDLRFQIRRYIIKRLEFDERGTPTQRRKLKELKRKFQRGLCFQCETKLPEQGAELHRLQAIEGYTEANTRLLCRACHQKAQHETSAVLAGPKASAALPETPALYTETSSVSSETSVVSDETSSRDVPLSVRD
jgi:ribosomal protein L44E